MTASFRQHCASALTHPVTLIAVAVLLANDLAFKLLWPDHWVTGKLSDLAWVVFAPPLLGLLLSFVTFRKPSVERAAIAVAYAGLPLTYAAFNSFGTVHEWVLALLLPLTGSAAGSPFDPTDSLVILPGLALALWVWRRAPAPPERTRTRLFLFAAVAASLASVASAPSPPSEFAWLVGITDQETVVIHGLYRPDHESSDGGITWAEVPYPESPSPIILWGAQEAATPRGTYAIRGFDIVLLNPDGQPTVAYSLALQDESNLWAQKYTSGRLRSEFTAMYGDPDEFLGKEPFNIVYHPRTSNVIVGLGLEGVLVGTPDGGWARIAVGEFVPTDFSYRGKAGLLLSTPSFWIGMLAISLIFLTTALVFSALVVSREKNIFKIITVSSYAVIGTTLALSSFPPYGRVVTHLGGFSDYSSEVAVVGLAFAILAAAIYFPRKGVWRAFWATLASMVALVPMPFLLWLTGGLALWVASLGAFILLTLIAGFLYQYLTKRRRANA